MKDMQKTQNKFLKILKSKAKHLKHVNLNGKIIMWFVNQKKKKIKVMKNNIQCNISREKQGLL